MEPTAQQFQSDKNRISIGDWMITVFIAAIPLVGVVMLFVWAFSGNTPETKANWAKATLLWVLITMVLGVIFMAVFGSLFFWKESYDL